MIVPKASTNTSSLEKYRKKYTNYRKQEVKKFRSKWVKYDSIKKKHNDFSKIKITSCEAATNIHSIIIQNKKQK